MSNSNETPKLIPNSLIHEYLAMLPRNALTGVLFAGDRAACIDFGVTIPLSGSGFAGVVTVAPKGEAMNGEPTIVGVYVFPQYRRRGYAKAMLIHAVELCVHQNLTPVRIEVMSTPGAKLVRSLPSEVQARLRVIEHTPMLNVFQHL